MATPSVARLGHVGLHVRISRRKKTFYRDIIGLTVTDEDRVGMVFLSARPRWNITNCCSAAVATLALKRGWCSRFHFDATRSKMSWISSPFKERGVKFWSIILCHGNAIGI